MKNKICRYCGADVTRTVPNCPVCGKSIDEIRKIGNDRSKQSEKAIGGNNLAVKITIFAFIFMIIVSACAFLYVKKFLKDMKGMVESASITQYRVGDTYSNNDYSITYLSNSGDYSQYIDSWRIKEGYKVVRYQLSIDNKTSSFCDTSFFYFKCISDDKEEDSLIGIEDTSISKKIEAGTEEEFIIYCEAPINSVNNKLEAKLDNKIYFISE